MASQDAPTEERPVGEEAVTPAGEEARAERFEHLQVIAAELSEPSQASEEEEKATSGVARVYAQKSGEVIQEMSSTLGRIRERSEEISAAWREAKPATWRPAS